MRRFIARNINGDIFPVMGTLNARREYLRSRDKIGRGIIWLPFAYLVSPFLFVALVLYIAWWYYQDIHSVFFFNRDVHAKYKEILKPMVGAELFSVVGYRIFPEELNDHLSLVNSEDKESLKTLGKKGGKMKRVLDRQFGFSVDKLTRHLAFIGSTGAGKTETIMSFFEDVVRSGAGLGMIDGKSDQEMEYKIYNLCKKHYYETQFQAVILNRPEMGTESNTYSPLLSYSSAMKASEFLGEFLETGDGGGNHDYFVNRGKVMMGNIVMYYKNRHSYYGENFSIADLGVSMNPVELNNIYYMAYGVILSLERQIVRTMKQHRDFAGIVSRAHAVKTPNIEFIRHAELLYEYINQNSHLSRDVELALGVKYKFFSDHYELYTSTRSYIEGISVLWFDYTHTVARAIDEYMMQTAANFLYTASIPVRMANIRRAYDSLKLEGSHEHKIVNSSPNYLPSEYNSLRKALGIDGDAHAETVENINPENMRQHQYAHQQWQRVFDLFKAYNQVYGTPNPEVDGEDILKNNKVLFTMLPVMELSPDQIQILGKMHILMFKNIAAIAIGGDKQSATPIQFKIYQNRIKPNPVFLMVLDEIGSYVTTGLSYLLSQVRSLKISMILSGQDTVSLKPGSNENELKRIQANVGKLILQNRDSDTMENLDKIVPEIEVLESDSLLQSAVSGRVISTSSVTPKTVKPLDLRISASFQKGMGMYIDGRKEEPVLFQSYYLGDNSEFPLLIRRFDSFYNIKQAT